MLKAKIGILAVAIGLALSGTGERVQPAEAHGTWWCKHYGYWISPGALLLKYSGRYRSGSSDIHVYSTIAYLPDGRSYLVDVHKRICGTWH